MQDIGTDEWVIQNTSYRKRLEKCGLSSNVSEQQPITHSSEHGTDFLVSINANGEILKISHQLLTRTLIL